MIYTLTINPALDLYIDLKTLSIGKINHDALENLVIGGKGINVSFALKELGIETVPIVLVGGLTGAIIKKTLKDKFANSLLINNVGETRINVKINHDEKETAINGVNKLSDEALKKTREILLKLTKDDILVVSGSGKLNNYLYLLTDLKCQLILDLTGENLLGLKHLKPLIVKPNEEELAQIDTKKEIALAKLENDVDIILNTCGDKGVLVRINKNDFIFPARKALKVYSTVGGGDIFLAGFIASYIVFKKNLNSSIAFAQECAYNYITKRKLQ